jgi:hypothetical protein
MLSAPLLDQCRGIVERSDSAIRALEQIDIAVLDRGEITFAVDIAKRAVVQSFQSDDRSAAFGVAVFAETTNYLLSRDLGGLIGSSTRCPTTSDSIRFKSMVLNTVVDDIREFSSSTSDWQSYVGRTVDHLARRRQ